MHPEQLLTLGAKQLIALVAVAMATQTFAQIPLKSPIQQAIVAYSRQADGSTPTKRKLFADRFERSLIKSDRDDPWYPRAQYDLGYDWVRAGEPRRAVRAFDKVLACKTILWPGLRSAAADQRAQAIESCSKNAREVASAFRLALRLIERSDPLASYNRMTYRESIASAMIDDSRVGLKETYAQIDEYIHLGRQGVFAPPRAAAKLLPDFKATTWEFDAWAMLRHLADAGETRRDIKMIQWARVKYVKSGIIPGREIAFDMNLVSAVRGPNLTLQDVLDVLRKDKRASPSRGQIVARALGLAQLEGNCKVAIPLAQELLAMPAAPAEDEDPAQFGEQAQTALKACGEKPLLPTNGDTNAPTNSKASSLDFASFSALCLASGLAFVYSAITWLKTSSNRVRRLPNR